MGKAIKILMIEDNPFDVELIVHALKYGGFDPDYRRVENRSEMQDALHKEEWDLITCDHSMPEFSAPEALELLQSMNVRIPVIIVSGEIDLALAVSLLKKGAWDYVQKGDLERLPLSIERELENARLLHHQQKAEEARQNSEQNLRFLFENSYDAIAIHDFDGNIHEVNSAFLKLLGVDRKAALQMNAADFFVMQYPASEVKKFWERIIQGEEILFEMPVRRKCDDQEFHVEVGVKKLCWQGEDMIFASSRDITERKNAEKANLERKSLLKALVDNLPLDFWVRNRQGEVVLQSRHGRQLWGEGEGHGLDEMDLIPEMVKAWEENYQRALAGEVVDKVEKYRINGQDVYVRSFLAPVSNSGAIEAVVGANVNVNARRKIEDELRTSLERFDIFAGMITDCMFYASIDDSGEPTIEWNYGKMEKICGYTFAELAERKDGLWSVVHPDDVDKVRQAAEEVHSQKKIEQEFRVLHKNGGIQWVRNCMKSDWNDDRQSVVGLHSVFRSIAGQNGFNADTLDSGEHFTRLYENLADIAYVMEPSGRFRLLNRAALEILGYSKEEAGSLYLQDVLAPEAYEFVNTTVWDELREKGLSRHMVTVVTKSGELRNWDCVGSLIYRPGREGLLHGIARDMTEQDDMRRQIQESEQLYKSLVEVTPQGVYRMDLQGNITYANQNALDMFGYTQEDLDAGINFMEVFLPREYERAQARIQGIARGEIEPGSEYLCVRKDGTPFYALAYIAPVVKNGEPICMQGTILNIDDRKRIENELVRLNNELENRVEVRTRELEAANRELEAFGYMAGHDLRAPLRAIGGFANILSMELGDHATPEIRHLIEVITGNVDKMGRLIDDLLKFSKINRQSITLNRVNMTRLAEEVCVEIESYQDGRAVIWDIAELHEADCDRGLMRQVLFNLLSNAWKFTRQNEEARINIFSHREESEVVYTVKDNGVGFNMNYYDRLFSAFKRLHSQAEFDGTGVGLAIVQGIINRHGGRIWAESTPQMGAEFHFSLPVSRVVNEPLLTN